MQITAFFKSYKLDNIIKYMDKITFMLKRIFTEAYPTLYISKQMNNSMFLIKFFMKCK